MSADIVRRRHVFFLSGFDPKGASYYHGIYQAQAALQAGVTGARYEVGPRQRAEGGNSQWTVRGEHEGQATQTTFEYVRWDDIVREHWPRRGWDVFLGSLRGYGAAIASGMALVKVWRVAPKTLVSLAYPAFFWLMVLVLGAVLGFGLVALLRLWPAFAALASAWQASVGVGAALALWAGALRWERKINTSWLLRIYQFAGDWSLGRNRLLPPRLDQLADAVLRRLREPDIDEVLVVGFSVGSMLAVSGLARVHQRAAAEGVPLDRLSLMTLGHCIPLLGLMPGAHGFRAELARLGQDPRIEWVDFSSPTDWGSFALIDPLALCLGPGGDGRTHAPTMASPRFHVMFEPDVYAGMIGNKRRMHMQYLMAGEKPALYDFFAITAGPSSLPRRMAGAKAP